MNKAWITVALGSITTLAQHKFGPQVGISDKESTFTVIEKLKSLDRQDLKKMMAKNECRCISKVASRT